MKKINATCFGIIGLALMFLVPSVSADSITFTLNVPNDLLSPSPGPYATVEVNRTDSTHATITFTALSGFEMTDGSSAAVNVNASSFTITSVVDADFKQIADPPGTSQVDGFGKFNGTIDNNSSANGVTLISFVLTDTGSPTWASASDVLTANPDGFFAAAHIGACADTACTSFSRTGYASTPEPATVLLVGTLLSGLGFFGRKKFIDTLKG